MAKITAESFTTRKKFSTLSIIMNMHANVAKGPNFVNLKRFWEFIRPKKVDTT